MMFPENRRPYIIAEIGANHNGDMELARRMIDKAKELGCDAVKFQSWDENLFSSVVYRENRFLNDDYRERKDYTLIDIMKEFKVEKREMVELASYCKSVGIDFSSTPFTPEQVDDLVALGAPYVKIASMDLISDYLLKHAAATQLPVVISTGFATLEEIAHAVETLESAGACEIVILHCLGLYPPPDDAVNLANIEMLRGTFGRAVGFSDHTLGPEIAIASCALRSVIIEKHFTLDKGMFGWDHKISADPAEMAAICTARDRIHSAMGSHKRILSESERARSKEYRRSIVASRAIKAGEKIGWQDIDYKRPGRGLMPNYDRMIVGAKALRDIGHDELVTLRDLQFE